MTEVAAAVVGTGFIGSVHVEALRRLDIPVLGVVGSSAERAEAKARALRVPLYPTFEAMLADPRVTVVHITTPNYLHFPQVKAVIAAGKHVVCEKPLAMTAAESAEALHLARAAGIVHVVNFNIRFYPLVQHARALIQSGELGTVRIIQGSYLQDWLMLPTDWNWRLEPALGGESRAVADIGSHWLDAMTFITGEPIRAVMADLATFLPVRHKPTSPVDTFSGKEGTASGTVEQPIATEDYASTLLRFAHGARGVLTVSQVSPGRKNRLSYEIGGARSSLAWDSERPEELWLGRREVANGVLLRDPALLQSAARGLPITLAVTQKASLTPSNSSTKRCIARLPAARRPSSRSIRRSRMDMRNCSSVKPSSAARASPGGLRSNDRLSRRQSEGREAASPRCSF